MVAQPSIEGSKTAAKTATVPKNRRGRAIPVSERDWQGAVEALRAGMPLTALDQHPHFPSYHLVRKRIAEDAEFAALVGPLIETAIDPPDEDFAAALRHLQAGACLKDVRDGPGQPTLSQWRRKMKRDPAFGSAVEEALAAHRQGKSRPYPAAVWRRVVEEAAKLKSLTAVAKLPGMPTYEGILVKMARDSTFDAAIRQHVKLGPRIRHGRETILKAAKRIEEGASYAAIRAEGICGRRAFLSHLTADPELARRLGGRLPTPIRYDPEAILKTLAQVGGATSLRKIESAGGISRSTLYKWSRRDGRIAEAAAEAVSRVTRGRAAVYGEADYLRALAHLQAGNPISSLREFGLPSPNALRKRGRFDSHFAEQYRAAVRIYGGLGHASDGFALERSLSQNELYAAVDRVLSRGLDPVVREEVRSEMILAVLDGEISEAEITRETARAFVADYHRSAMTWGSRSLDAPSWEGSSRSLHEVFAG